MNIGTLVSDPDSQFCAFSLPEIIIMCEAEHVVIAWVKEGRVL